MNTIKEIAAFAKVSPATVSNVLNNRYDQVSPETREKILRIIRETNFKPNRIAKSLRVNRTHTIGVIAEDITVFNTPPIINGINAFSEQSNYRIILNDLGLHQKMGHNFSEISRFKNTIDGSLAVLLSFQVDGIIYVGLHPRDVTGVLSIVDKPVLYVGCYAKNQISVTYDDKSAFYKATKTLIDLRHDRIALIAGPSDSLAAEARLAGYKEALEHQDMLYREELVFTGDWSYESGHKLGKLLIDSDMLPTAILAMNDLMAIGAVNALQDSGLQIPNDISVIGFDNREFCQYTKPSLTTVQLPLYEMGYMAANTLIALVDKEDIDHSIKLPCDLIVRDSVGLHPDY